MTVIYVKEELGARLKKARGKLTQKELGAKLGVSRSYVSDVENGRVKPSLEYLIKAADTLSVSIDWLVLNRSPKPSENDPPERRLYDSQPELRDMVGFLHKAWSRADPELQSWIKIQFLRAFPEYSTWRSSTDRAAENKR